MYIWLKEKGEKELKALQQKGVLGKNFRVDTNDDTGKKYLSIYEEELDPLLGIIPEEIVERVTMKEKIYRNFRPEGIYHHEGAELVVKTEVMIHSNIYVKKIERDEYQDLSISGPSVKVVKTIYSLVRQKKLDPDENWGEELPTETPVNDAK